MLMKGENNNSTDNKGDISTAACFTSVMSYRHVSWKDLVLRHSLCLSGFVTKHLHGNYFTHYFVIKLFFPGVVLPVAAASIVVVLFIMTLSWSFMKCHRASWRDIVTFTLLRPQCDLT